MVEIPNRAGTKNFDVLYFMNSFSIKKELLYFDVIYYNEQLFEESKTIADLLSPAMCRDNGKIFMSKVKEVEFFKEQGILIPFTPYQPRSANDHYKFLDQTKISEPISQLEKLGRKKRSAIRKLLQKADRTTIQDLWISSTSYTDLDAIIMAGIMYYQDVNCTPVISNESYMEKLSSANKLVNLIIRSFPIINTAVDWDVISSFKGDPEINGHMQALRNWLVDLSGAMLTSAEVQEKLGYFINEYKRQITLHREMVAHTKLENNVLMPLTIIEHVIKANFSEVGKTLLSKKRQRIELAIQKVNLQGKEAAFIVNVLEQFDNEKSRIVKNTGATK